MREQVILIVDDQEFVLGLLATTISMQYQVFTAKSGEAAMDMIGKVQPDLLLLDIGLGDGMDGYELCRQIRATWGGRRVPILMMSGHGESARIACMKAGANGYLLKPYSPTYLMDRINTLLGVGVGNC